MRNLFLIAVMALGLAASAVASDTNNAVFNANEFSLSIGSGYNVNAFGAQNVKEAFATPYNFNLNAGAQYFVTKNLGLEANVPFYQTKGVSVSEVQAGALVRVPVLRHVAPYAGLGGAYAWNDARPFSYIAKGGLEFRLNKGWGLFAEADYRNSNFDFEKGAVSVNGGLRLVLW